MLVEGLKTELGSAKWDKLMTACEMAIRTAHQLRLAEQIENTGEAAKAYALEAAQRFLVAQGLEEIDLKVIDDLIEGIYQMIKDTLEDSLPELGDVPTESRTPVPWYIPLPQSQ